MVKKIQKCAFLFPGQGAQYAGMAKDFVQNFSAARFTFDEADTLLHRPLSSIILEGPEETLKETKNSQAGIFVASIAILRVLQELYDLKPYVTAGLSLGEYTALTAGEWISFREALPLVQQRGELMNEACHSTEGVMAVILGLDGPVVKELVEEINLPEDLWVANYNCPGQVVISGTPKGIEQGTLAAKEKNAKRVLPLPVHGAFHSGLMKEAEKKLEPFIQKVTLVPGRSKLVMNVTGGFVSSIEQIRQNLSKQVTHSVMWEQGIKEMEKESIDLYIEFGPGKTLSGMNKRIGVKAHTISLEKIEDLEQLSQLHKQGEI